VLGVPYIAVDPVADPPVRATLARSPWIVLRLGRTGEFDFPEPVEPPGVSVLGTSIAHIDVTQRRWETLLSMAYGTKRPRWLEPTPVRHDDLEQAGIRPPAAWVWLTGPEGSCKAALGRPWVALYGGPRGDVLEVSYELRGCQGGPWAPVASLADDLPEDLAYVPSRTEAVVDLPSELDWDDPRAAWAAEPRSMTPNRRTIRTLTVPTQTPSATQILYSHLVVGREGRCQARATEATFGWWDARTLVVDEPVIDHESPPVLVGAFVRDGEPHALVFREGVWGWVAVPPSDPVEPEDVDLEDGPTADPGPAQWTRIELATAVWHPDDAVALSYVPVPCREGQQPETE